MTSHAPEIDILLVEDNAAEARLVQEALKDAKVRNNVHRVADGFEAMEYLRQTGKYSQAPRPDLILLDLNLPRKDGREVLADIKSDGSLKRIPVVVMTTSQDEQDVLKSYDLHANCYIVKPIDLEQFMRVVRMIDEFWVTIVKLPSN